MASVRPSLIVPVENQVRELDPKLLLACVAAERGFVTFLGSRTRVDFRVARLPRSIYLSKSMTPKSAKMFRILRRLGHEVAVWDEEALVYLSPEHYYARRISPQTLPFVSTLFAWGQDNAEMFRMYQEYSGTPIHVVGNPRIDLLRPELRDHFEKDARRLRERFGKFVLVNTNFSMVNGFLDSLNLFRRAASRGAEPELGAAGKGTTREFAAGYAAHKGALFEGFKEFLPVLAEAFPECTFILRPHPSENVDTWVEAGGGRDNVQVVHEGNVIPWLLATEAVVHNGSTTAVEAFVLGVPAISFRPVKAAPYDFDLPNALSHESTSVEELRETLGRVLSGALGCLSEPAMPRPFEEYLVGLEGPLASDRIVEALEQSDAVRQGLARPPVGDYLRGWFDATQRSYVKQRIKARIPEHRNNPAFQQHRFPGVSLDELRDRIARLGGVLGRFGDVEAEPVAEHIFLIHA
jgi:surface carbohydrate biosynthesis protein